MTLFELSLVRILAHCQIANKRVNILMDALSSAVEYPNYSDRARIYINALKETQGIRWDEDKKEVVIL